MTALDQAFIKAFSQQGAFPAAAAPRPATPTSKDRPLTLGEDQDEEREPSGEEQESKNEAPAAPAALFDRFDGILAALENMPSLPTDQSKAEGRRGDAEVERGMGGCSPIEVGSGQWVVGGAEWAVGDESFCPPTKVMVPGPEPQTSIPEPKSPVPGPLVPNLEYRPPIPEPQPLEPEFRVPNPESRTFRPAWQVDRFTWPRVCRRLISRAADEWDRLADALLAGGAEGRKVLAIAGCRRGEGATTLLLCTARRLAERGVKTALVDADLRRPRLAKQLGVQPQIGWNETSDEEGKTIDQAVVEASAGNLALLAAREVAGDLPGDWSQWASCLEQLRNHYGMVLVAPGPLEFGTPAGDAPPWATHGNIDALLLVHNRRVTPKEELIEAQRRLTEAGITVAGMIENFVAK